METETVVPNPPAQPATIAEDTETKTNMDSTDTDTNATAAPPASAVAPEEKAATPTVARIAPPSINANKVVPLDAEPNSPLFSPKTPKPQEKKNYSKLYYLMEEPSSSRLATEIAHFMTLVVVASIVAFCLETERSLNTEEGCGETCWLAIDIVFIAIFTIEFLLRWYIYAADPVVSSKDFWIDPMNIIDFLAIIPSYIEYVLLGTGGSGKTAGLTLFLNIVKLLKVLRVFKLMKHFGASVVLMRAIKDSINALYVPGFFLMIAVLLLSSIMFLIETDQPDSGYTNIFQTMYFMIVTMTSVGYGDVSPSSTFGKVACSFCALFGILYTAMPLTIVGNSFYNNWKKYLEEKELEAGVQKAESDDPNMPPRQLVGKQRAILAKYLALSASVEKLNLTLTSITTKGDENDVIDARSMLKLNTAHKEAKVSNAQFSSMVYRSTGGRNLLRSVTKKMIRARRLKSLLNKPAFAAEDIRNAETGKRGWRDRVYLLLEVPESSKAAAWIAHFIIFAVLFSVIVFCLETIPELADPKNVNPDVWVGLEATFTIIFTVEFGLRLAVTPQLDHFLKDVLNLFDFLGIVPFYLEMIFGNIGDAKRVLKLCKVLRIFKMARQFSGTRLLVDTFNYSYKALLVPGFFLVVFVLIFSSLLYFLEGQTGTQNEAGDYLTPDGEPTFHKSIFTCFWLIIITMTTVGYGDISPYTTQGKLVCVVAMLFGVIYTAMPLTIIGGYFFDAWEKSAKAVADPDAESKAFKANLSRKHKQILKEYESTCKEEISMIGKKLKAYSSGQDVNAVEKETKTLSAFGQKGTVSALVETTAKLPSPVNTGGRRRSNPNSPGLVTRRMVKTLHENIDAVRLQIASVGSVVQTILLSANAGFQ